MCGFCEALKEKKRIYISQRTVFADDNLCEYITKVKDCNECKGCFHYDKKDAFHLMPFLQDGNVYISLEYMNELNSYDGKKVIIRPFSEIIKFNFCPVCGMRISKKITKWDDYYTHVIDIED